MSRALIYNPIQEMYHLSNFSSYSDKKPKPNILKPLKAAIGSVPHLPEQLNDLKKLGTAKLFQSTIGKNKPTLQQKVKGAKMYLKYRKFLGDLYGKEKGMSILKDQTNFLKGLKQPKF